MKILHQLGHNHKWPLDAYFQNSIGDGFIFSAYNFPFGKIGSKISTYTADKYIDKSMIDLQFYGSKDTTGGQLASYPFSPMNIPIEDDTATSGIELIEKSITYQENLNIKKIIVPVFYHELKDLEKFTTYIKKINKIISKRKDKGSSFKYYMTIPFSNSSIKKDEFVEKLLQLTTDMSIVFDGFYIVCDASPEYKKKISTDFSYYENLVKVFRVYESQGLETIHGYANWDSLIFASLCNINYMTIGTYETLRNFNIQRFTEDASGGPSKGWYFSEVLLNFIRADDLTNLRRSGCLSLIENEKNIFSDIILKSDYVWNTHKPDIHKNYLLSISRLYKELCGIENIQKRAELLLEKIETARNTYEKLASEYKVYLTDESSNYHLGMWAALIKKHGFA
jgi:hypothetical protein